MQILSASYAMITRSISINSVEAQLGHNLRTDERKDSWGRVEVHSGHTFLLGTVGVEVRGRSHIT